MLSIIDEVEKRKDSYQKTMTRMKEYLLMIKSVALVQKVMKIQSSKSDLLLQKPIRSDPQSKDLKGHKSQLKKRGFLSNRTIVSLMYLVRMEKKTRAAKKQVIVMIVTKTAEVQAVDQTVVIDNQMVKRIVLAVFKSFQHLSTAKKLKLNQRKEINLSSLKR